MEDLVSTVEFIIPDDFVAFGDEHVSEMTVGDELCLFYSLIGRPRSSVLPPFVGT
jgi:hypothetical protein